MDKNRIPQYAGPAISDSWTKMTNEEIRNRFDHETAALYSQRKPAWLPDFEFSFGLIQQTLKALLPDQPRILDLGTGTGNLSRTIFETFPGAIIDLVDFSQNMLTGTGTVLAGYAGRFRTLTADIFEYEPDHCTYQAVISSFAIHHARDTETYLRLYERIFQALKPSGVFICCDVIDGGSPALSGLNEANWSRFLKEADFPEDEIDRILNNYHREDSPLSLKMHLDLLSRAGFQTVDIIWKKFNFGIYLGIKT